MSKPLDRFHLSPRSSNAKTGAIPVSTSTSATCPAACPLSRGGCYAKGGHLAMHWRAVDKGRGDGWREHLATLDAVLAKRRAAVGDAAPWRMNQAGDLPGLSDRIDAARLSAVVEVNARHRARGFTYTHKPLRAEDVADAVKDPGALAAANRAAVADALARGFTINLSANSPAHADALADLNLAPVVVLLPRDAAPTSTTPSGRKVIVCPAQQREGINCATCQLCARATRSVVVGFRAHGSGARRVEDISAKPCA